MRSLTAALRYIMMQQETGEVVLVLLTITHPSLSEPIRLVNDATSESGSTNLVRGGQTYVAFPFDIQLPTDVDSEAPRARLTVCNVSREIVAFARSANPAPEVMIEIVRAAAPDEGGTVFGPLEFGSPEIDDLWVTTDLVSTDESLMPASAIGFDAAHFPALWRAAT